MIVAKLKVFGQEREVIHAEVMYHRMVNTKTGRAGAVPLGGYIYLSLYSGYEDDVLLRWITHTEEEELCKLTEGELSFYKDSFDNQKLFTYKFNDAALVEYREVFTSQGEHPMTISLVISPAIQEYKGQKLIKHWQQSYIPPSKQQPYQATDNEETAKKLIRYYITDLSGNELDDYESDTTILLNIETKNRIGDVITIELQNKKHDFKYQGQVLKNDTLEGIVVNNESEKIKLEVIDQQEEV